MERRDLLQVTGASPDHILACRIEAIEVLSPGFTALVPGAGAFPDWGRIEEFGVHYRLVDCRDGMVLWDRGIEIPMRPMVGVLGTAPLLEAVSTADNWTSWRKLGCTGIRARHDCVSTCQGRRRPDVLGRLPCSTRRRRTMRDGRNRSSDYHHSEGRPSPAPAQYGVATI